MTAELGWSRTIGSLGRDYRVVAPDLRGHGDGIACGRRFSLEECADDVAALVGVLGMEQVIVVGYSMGGMVAQLLWRRHPKLVAGAVLCATARNVRGSPLEQMVFFALPMMAATLHMNPAAHVFTSQVLAGSLLGPVDDAETRNWARDQLNRTSLSNALSALQAVSDFSSREWIGDMNVPAVVVITTEDRLVPPSRQRRLAAAIPGAKVIEVPADHGVCFKAPGTFAHALGMACRLVLNRD